MTTKATGYRLIALNSTAAVCDACGRECRERHVIVADGAGVTLKLGTTCAWNLYGIKPTDHIEPVEAELTDADKQASLDFLLSWMG